MEILQVQLEHDVLRKQSTSVHEGEWLFTQSPCATDTKTMAVAAGKEEFGGRWLSLQEVSTQLCLAHILKQLK